MPPPFPAPCAKRDARGAFRAPGRGKGEGMHALATSSRPRGSPGFDLVSPRATTTCSTRRTLRPGAEVTPVQVDSPPPRRRRARRALAGPLDVAAPTPARPRAARGTGTALEDRSRSSTSTSAAPSSSPTTSRPRWWPGARGGSSSPRRSPRTCPPVDAVYNASKSSCSRSRCAAHELRTRRDGHLAEPGPATPRCREGRHGDTRVAPPKDDHAEVAAASRRCSTARAGDGELAAHAARGGAEPVRADAVKADPSMARPGPAPR